MRRFVAISACVLVGAAPPANATDSGGLYRVFGVGGSISMPVGMTTIVIIWPG